MEIREFLIETGNFPNLNGYSCLIMAVDIVKKNKDLRMVKGVYSIIAKEKNSTVQKVERAMRHIINRTPIEDFKKIGLTKRPTVSEFVYYFAEGGRHE